MAEVATIWREGKGVYRDSGRDNVPSGSVWDLLDFVPNYLGAPERMRGAWTWKSTPLPNTPDGMIYAPFKDGSRILVANGASLEDVAILTDTVSPVGAIVPMVQNPVFHRDRVILPAGTGAHPAKVLTRSGGAYALAELPSSALQGRYATMFKDRVVLGWVASDGQRLAFSKPGNPSTEWDSASVWDTSLPLSGLAAQRNQILCFHDGSVERLRGTTPPDTTLSDPTGDLIMDVLFDRAGCWDARSIAYWNDNVVFADERGVHLTDGAIVRNMSVQGGWERVWRDAFHGVASIAGSVFSNYYIATMRRTGVPPLTFVIDIPTRNYFSFSNIDATCFTTSIGTGERILAVDAAAKRLIDLTPAFTPDPTVIQADANGAAILPRIELGWQRLSKRAQLKRIKEVYVSYDTGDTVDGSVADPDAVRVEYLDDPAETTLTTLGHLKRTARFRRRKLPFGRQVLGVALRLSLLQPSKDFRLYDISARVDPVEEQRL